MDRSTTVRSNNVSQNFALSGNLRNISERVAYLINSYLLYGSMSNNAYEPEKDNPKATRPGTWGSLEDIHNSIHVAVGGHMGGTGTSAFDPIFWLHHT